MTVWLHNVPAPPVFATLTVRSASPPTATVVVEGAIVTPRFGTDEPPPPPPPPLGGGGGDGVTTVNADALCAVPPGVVTLTGPVLAPAGTDVSISVAETTENVAAV